MSWRELWATAAAVFLVGFVGCIGAFALWIQDLQQPQVAILGSGNALSLLITDGPARLLIATGDDPIAFENALSEVRPIFARRVDVLLVAGNDDTLLVPLAAHADRHVRTSAALAPLPPSAEPEEFGAIETYAAPRAFQLGPTVRVTVETASAAAGDLATDFPAWRVTVERGDSRIVALSDGAAAALFPPGEPAAVLVVAGDDPVEAWNLAPAVALVANAEAIGGPDLRGSFGESRRPPRWGFRVHPNEALRLRFVPGGVEIPAETGQNLAVEGAETP